MAEWERIEEKIAVVPSLNPAKHKFLGRVNYSARPRTWMRKDGVADTASQGEGQDGGRCGGVWDADFYGTGQPRRFLLHWITDPLTANDEKAAGSFRTVSRDVKTSPKGEHMTRGIERHVPVLLEEAIRYLNVRPGGTYADATLGWAGHSEAIARNWAAEDFIGFDRDPESLRVSAGAVSISRNELGEQTPEVIFNEHFPP